MDHFFSFLAQDRVADLHRQARQERLVAAVSAQPTRRIDRAALGSWIRATVLSLVVFSR